MKHARVLSGGVLLLVLAAAAIYQAQQARKAAGPDIHTLTVGSTPWAVTIDAKTGHVVVVNRTTDRNGLALGQGSVSMIDAAGNTVLRTVPVGPDPRSAVVDSSPAPGAPDGLILVANDDDASLSVLDARSGRPLRTISVGANPHAVAVDPPLHRAFVLNTGDGTVSVLDTQHWHVIRKVGVGANFTYASLAVDVRSGRVFVGVGSSVTVLDAAKGTILGVRNVAGTINGMSVDPGFPPRGRVFVATSNGISVLDGRDGRMIGTVLAGRPIGAVAADTRRHHLIVTPSAFDGAAPGGGLVRVVDERSGAILRSIASGVAPVAVAVDARSGRAVVVNAGGIVAVADPWHWMPGWLRAYLPWIAPGPGTRAVPGSISVFDTTAQDHAG